MDSVTDRCPWCGTTISRDKFQEIEARIREEEQKRLAEALAEAEADLRKRFELERQAAEKRAKEEADRRVAELSTKLNQTLEQLNQAKVNKAAEIQQAQKEAAERAKKEFDAEFRQQRLALERDKNQGLLEQQAKFNEEREAYQKKITDLGRQLQQKAEQEVSGAEINLFEDLQENFVEDRITRLHEGKPSERLLHEVLYRGAVCGRILIDARNRQAWQNTFASKLRVEQLEMAAEHAILSSTVFPRGKKELCIEEGVIVVNPGRVIHVIELIRAAIIKMHIQGLSIVDRTEKTSRLYDFICSQTYAQKAGEAASLTTEILDLDVHEEKEHKKVWQKRGALATRLKGVLREIDTDISSILEGNAEGKARTAKTTGPDKQKHLRRVL